MSDKNRISRTVVSGEAEDVMKLTCPECGSLLRISYSTNFGGNTSIVCECMDFGIKQDGVAPPPWVLNAPDGRKKPSPRNPEHYSVVIENGAYSS